eukprot:CAMPEP_0175091448 /NCGR_PEP_ID=MMETSP0086_2-20121207/1906_1 /TAXON_ID=136419 /ORGANISM="Unknown Unknown, Strain D1" /LENGTH=452 /DNA_ID=CAMNT_0016364187 /DNA_START=532 /DNA_END=1887 /DNA_ORIENTATION=-
MFQDTTETPSINMFEQEKKLALLELKMRGKSMGKSVDQTRSPYTRTALVTALSPKPVHLQQFFAFMHPTWVYQTSQAQRLWRTKDQLAPETKSLSDELRVILDLVVFCEEGTCESFPITCQLISAQDDWPVEQKDESSRCVFVPLTNYTKTEYRFLSSLNFLITTDFRRRIVESNIYDYVLRADTDTLVGPGSSSWVPPGNGSVGYGFSGDTTDNITGVLLRKTAAELGLTHRGLLNMQSTFYLRVECINQFSALLVNLTQWMFEHSFTEDACARWEAEFSPLLVDEEVVCEWPRWHKAITSLYATNLAFNHLIASPSGLAEEVTMRLDYDDWRSEAKNKFGFAGVVLVHLLYSKHKEEDTLIPFLKNACAPLGMYPSVALPGKDSFQQRERLNPFVQHNEDFARLRRRKNPELVHPGYAQWFAVRAAEQACRTLRQHAAGNLPLENAVEEW